jgi:hypothetical protein
MDHNIGHSAVKNSPQNRRFVREFNAPPYQGRVAPSEVSLVYHCVFEYYTLNASKNPRYQPNPQRSRYIGHQGQSNMNQQGTPL